jgi:hypothetical protein
MLLAAALATSAPPGFRGGPAERPRRRARCRSQCRHSWRLAGRSCLAPSRRTSLRPVVRVRAASTAAGEERARGDAAMLPERLQRLAQRSSRVSHAKRHTCSVALRGPHATPLPPRPGRARVRGADVRLQPQLGACSSSTLPGQGRPHYRLGARRHRTAAPTLAAERAVALCSARASRSPLPRAHARRRPGTQLAGAALSVRALARRMLLARAPSCSIRCP